jgi:hypothetical protein
VLGKFCPWTPVIEIRLDEVKHRRAKNRESMFIEKEDEARKLPTNKRDATVISSHGRHRDDYVMKTSPNANLV